MFGWGMGTGFLSVIGGMFVFAMWFICFVVAVAVIFLLVRFLLVGTKAAQIYVAQHEPAQPAAKAAASVPLQEDASSKVAAVQDGKAKVSADQSTAAKGATVTAAPVKASTKKAPAKPAATSVPRTPKTPKSTTPKAAPKKP